MIGTQVSHYRLTAKLGEGTYGAVYRGEHVHDAGFAVAVKVVDAAVRSDPSFAAALKKECRALDRMDHPSIVRFRELVISDGLVAMVLELLEGSDLESALEEGPQPVAEVVRVLDAALSALAYAHAKGVVHRDLKPGNVYRCTDGRVKLLDFGIARAAEGTRASQTGTLKGTLDYMAPERFTEGGGGPASDVYALGLVAWELLAGQRACRGADLPQKMGWHLGVGVSDVRGVRPECPGWLAELVASMAHREVGERLADGEAALALLRATQQETPVLPAAPIVTRPQTVTLDTASLPPPVVPKTPPVTPTSSRPQTVTVPPPTPSPEVARSEPASTSRPTSGAAKAAMFGAGVLVVGGLGVGGLAVLVGALSALGTSVSSTFETVAEEVEAAEGAEAVDVAEEELEPEEPAKAIEPVEDLKEPESVEEDKHQVSRVAEAPVRRAGRSVQSAALGTLRWAPDAGVYVMEHEVTQAQWQAVMGSNPSKFSGCGQCPVEQVSWDDSVTFAEKVSAREGVTYRLLTEKEWEAAARGGESHEYAGSDDLDAVGWHDGNSGNKTHPVCEKERNAYGLCDMSGNVREWTSSAWSQGSAGRVDRGGSWVSAAQVARVVYRSRYTPDYRSYSLGLRLARTVP